MKATTYSPPLSQSVSWLSWFIVFAGFLPVLSIVMHCVGILSLQYCLKFIILPAFSIGIIASIKFSSIGKVALMGWLGGVLAVSLYDLSRVPFILNGWNDFIPKIGAWMSNTNDPDFVLGYLWRYIGNGGGMGAAFFVLVHQLGWSRKKIVLIGLTYGLFIFSCLMLVLVSFKEAQEMMFKITSFTFAGSLTGHIIYGLVLGLVARKYFRG